jgi:2,5-diamino-6-(ribosylamino)-4(3H)-pyrimidinone 5'-phosphate reductase
MTVIHQRPLLGNPMGDDRAYLALNMVATVDGRAAVNGSAVGIGSTADKRLMRELRAEADVVLHGAGTVRADRLSARVPADLVAQRLAHGLSAQPVGAIVTRSGNLPREHPYYESATVIYITSDRPVVSGPTIEVCRVMSVTEAVRDLGRRGARRILCEGGPTLNAALFQAGLVDEIFLTIAPKLIGGEQPLTIVKGCDLGTIHLELRSLVDLDGELFLKYGVVRGRAATEATEATEATKPEA